MDNRDLDEPDGNPFPALWLLMEIVLGPFLWPTLIANALVMVWLGYQGWQSFLAFLASF